MTLASFEEGAFDRGPLKPQEQVATVFSFPQVCRWKTLFMIFQFPSTFSSVNKSVNREPVQLSSSSRTVATVPMRSMLAIRAWSPVAGPLLSFQANSSLPAKIAETLYPLEISVEGGEVSGR